MVDAQRERLDAVMGFDLVGHSGERQKSGEIWLDWLRVAPLRSVAQTLNNVPVAYVTTFAEQFANVRETTMMTMDFPAKKKSQGSQELQ